MEDANKKIVNDLIGEFKSLITPKLILSFDALDSAVYDLAGATNSEKDKNRYFDQLESIKTQKDYLIEVFMNSIDRANNRFIDGNYIYVNIDEDHQEEATLSLSLVEDNTLDEYLARDNLVSKCEINCNTNLYGLEQRYAKLATLASLKTIEVPISPIVIVDSYRKSIDATQTKLDMDMHFRLMLYIIFDRNVLKNLNEVYNDVNEYLSSKGIVKNISFGFNNNNDNKEEEINLTSQNLSLDEKVETIDPNKKFSLADMEDIQDIEQSKNTTQSNQPANKNMDSSYQLISNILSNKSSNASSPTSSSSMAAGNNNLVGNKNSGQGSEFNTEFALNNEVQSLNVSSDLLEKFNQQAEKLRHSNFSSSDKSVNSIQKKAVDVDVLIKTLNSLQGVDFSKTNLSKKNKSPEEVKNEFIEELSKDNNEAIENEDMQAIDLIVLLFKYIVDDRNLPDAIQVILSHLQIPYLKIALQDNNLFADKTHPARLLLNELSIASVGWSKEVDENGVFLDEIKAISQKIIHHESYSDAYFNELIEEFITFNKKLNESTQEIQSQTNDKLHKKEKLVQAKKVAAEVLINKMTNKKMPKLFKDILLGSWLYILVLTDIKHSRMSDEYKDKVDFINKLITLAHFSEETTITKTQIDELLRQYIKGLKLVTFNREVVKKKLIKLKNKLVGIHFNLDFEATESETESQEIIGLAEIQDHELGVVSYIKEEEALSAANESIVVDDASLNLVKSMQIGDWLIFNDLDQNNKTIEAKLSWISPITGKYLFVLASGLKYKDIIPQSIAIGLTDKTMVIVESEPIFDRAMESIANTLQATA